jgi:hypothetical protein
MIFLSLLHKGWKLLMVMKNRKPDFFIVGAPKCGTTAMNNFLRQHPQIFMPERKDITYFGSDLQFRRPRISDEEYQSLFLGANGAARIGESSVWYLYSKRAAEEIKSFSPSACIIVMLRNPVDMLYAQHSQFLYNRNEDIEDFESALGAEEARKQGQLIPKESHFVEGLFYRETVKYAEQVKRYFNVFGRKSVHVIAYDDFKQDTAKVYRETLAFLGVDPSFQPSIRVINPNKTLRSRRLQGLLVAPPTMLMKIYRQVVPVSLQGRLLKRLKKLNTQHTDRPMLDPALKRRLQLEFQSEVQQLSGLLGRDLSNWSSS